MRKRFFRELAVLLLIPGLMFVVSCAKKQVKPTQAEIEAGQKATAEARKQEEARFQQKLAEDEGSVKARKEREMFQSEDIHFDYDKYNLRPEAQEILRRKAQWLMANSAVKVTIEGHCDERGTNEYNMALGDRRAQSAKAFMVDLGVKSDRLATVSYGEEKPVDPGHNEEAWGKNRRAHFALD